MKSEKVLIKKTKKLLYRRCHVCLTLMASDCEQGKCKECGKSFLPINYFSKIYSTKNAEFSELFENAEEAEHQELIKGLFVVW